MIYLDSAIVVKLFVNEADSAPWRTKLSGLTDFVSSSLLLPEARCALRRKAAEKFISKAGMTRIWKQIEQLTNDGTIIVYPIGRDVIDGSLQILDQLDKTLLLRTLDALHLATAQLVQPSGVATTDARMRAAATALAIPLI
jgi:predicted nucleic acid-binding protein